MKNNVFNWSLLLCGLIYSWKVVAVAVTEDGPGIDHLQLPEESDSLKDSQKFFFLQNDFHIRNNKSSVIFTLHTMDCQYGEKILIGRSIINKTCFNPDNELKVLIHGYTEKGHSINSMVPIRLAYFRAKRNVNVLMTDWSLHSVDPNYYNSARHLEEIGKYVAEFLVFMGETTAFTNMTRVHLVGFSLGAHVAGITGRYLHQATGQKVGRITGLDPAGPKFHLALPHERIRLDDADFLDFIHGDTDTYGGNFLGHVNFYPNGGRRQPGCLTIFEHFIGCGHRKTPQWFAESVMFPRKYLGCRCSDFTSFVEKACTCANRNDLAIMGEHCSLNAKGNYYLIIKRGDYQYEFGIYPHLISFGFTTNGTINNYTMPIIPVEDYIPSVPGFNYTEIDMSEPGYVLKESDIAEIQSQDKMHA
ncbi:unnamed protein product [Allacma fusca]|uniref:Lipase domain-containing protein n=1 Tax=Allacma fusca TaxID=39272 RepID=A0A8J2P8B4_9HEXA|nr:unnamed protein product [Allacma fusca]